MFTPLQLLYVVVNCGLEIGFSQLSTPFAFLAFGVGMIFVIVAILFILVCLVGRLVYSNL